MLEEVFARKRKRRWSLLAKIKGDPLYMQPHLPHEEDCYFLIFLLRRTARSTVFYSYFIPRQNNTAENIGEYVCLSQMSELN